MCPRSRGKTLRTHDDSALGQPMSIQLPQMQRGLNADLERARTRMVERHLVGHDIATLSVLNAFRRVARESFLPEELVEFGSTRSFSRRARAQ